MSSRLYARDDLEGLHGRLQEGLADTASLVAAVLNRYGRATEWPPHAQRLRRLIAAQAWTDIALELVKLELPQWSVRRLAQDDGLWYCALSRSPALPEYLDDPADGCGREAALAILDALVEAQRRAVESWDTPLRRCPGPEKPAFRPSAF